MRGDAGRCGEMRGDLELEGRRGGLLYLSSHLPPASPHTSALEARGGPVQPDGRSREDAASAALRCTRSARTRDTCTHSRTLVPSHKSAQPQARTRRSRRSPFTRRDVYSHKHSAPSAQGHTRTGRRERTETATDTSLCTSQGRGTSAARDHPRSPEIARDRPRRSRAPLPPRSACGRTRGSTSTPSESCGRGCGMGLARSSRRRAPTAWTASLPRPARPSRAATPPAPSWATAPLTCGRTSAPCRRTRRYQATGRVARC
mmetsp:Transcript_14078/g.41708  ORF Transcript_14078/g.41708 Transcript_14078/m.41708 type:complete len:260 (+) Transcript_14078:2-781(+)